MNRKRTTPHLRYEKLESLGPLAVKAFAFLAGTAVFMPLVAAFAAPFVS